MLKAGNPDDSFIAVAPPSSVYFNFWLLPVGAQIKLFTFLEEYAIFPVVEIFPPTVFQLFPQSEESDILKLDCPHPKELTRTTNSG